MILPTSLTLLRILRPCPTQAASRPPDPALGLVNSSRMWIAVLSGVAGCRNSDLYSTAIVLGNRTFPDYSWMLFTEDDTFFVPRSLASFLGMSNMSAALGLLTFAQGAGCLVSPPLAGLVVEHSGDALAALYMSGAFLLTSATVYSLAVISHERRSTKLIIYDRFYDII